jgi:ABC-type multidrug transport system ATPase subunit
VKGYSTGMRQALGIAAASSIAPTCSCSTNRRPDSIRSRDAFLGLVADARTRGATVFLSSHVLDEVDRLADRIAVIAQGRLRVVDTVERLRATLPRRVTVRRKDGGELVFDAMGPSASTAFAVSIPSTSKSPRFRSTPSSNRSCRGRTHERSSFLFTIRRHRIAHVAFVSRSR